MAEKRKETRLGESDQHACRTPSKKLKMQRGPKKKLKMQRLSKRMQSRVSANRDSDVRLVLIVQKLVFSGYMCPPLFLLSFKAT